MAANVNQPAGFARTPALLNQNAVLDYGTSEGIAIFDKGAKSLLSDKKAKLSLDTKSKTTLLQALAERARNYGWTELLQVPLDLDDPNGPNASFLEHPHVFTMEHLQDYAADHVDSQDRDDQNNTMMYLAIRETMAISALTKVDMRREEFTIGDQPSALCYLKAIIQASCLDTNKSATSARITLMNLKEVMTDEVGDYNINDFTDEISNNLEIIGHFQQEYNEQDLLINIITALRKVPDDRFQHWVDRKEDALNDGTLTDPNVLMAAAKTEYDSRNLDKDWCKPDAKDEQILALETKVEDLSLQLKKGNNKSNNSKTTTASDGKKKPFPKKPWDDWPAWKEGEPKMKLHTLKNGQKKPIHWCPKHKRWVVHKPEDCKIQPVAEQAEVEAQATFLENTNTDDDSDSDGYES